jgi:MIP family channel proteins
MRETMKACLAEAAGTFALVFLGAGAVCQDAFTGRQLGLVGVALAHGLILSVAVSATMNLSGGHLNPAVTFGFLLTGRIDRDRAWRYLVAQLAGATVAGFFLRFIFAEQVWQSVGMGTPHPAPDITSGTAIFVEAVLTFLLVFAVWATAVDGRAPKLGGFGIGLTLAAAILMGGALTGGALNPARAFGPAIASGHWGSHLIYWIGPLLGGGAAAVFYNSLLLRTSD